VTGPHRSLPSIGTSASTSTSISASSSTSTRPCPEHYIAYAVPIAISNIPHHNTPHHHMPHSHLLRCKSFGHTDMPCATYFPTHTCSNVYAIHKLPRGLTIQDRIFAKAAQLIDMHVLPLASLPPPDIDQARSEPSPQANEATSARTRTLVT